METIDSYIDNLNKGANSCVLFSENQVDSLRLDIQDQINQVNERCEWRIGQATIQLTNYISLFYLNTNHRVDQVVFHHSPSLIGVLLSIWTVITSIVKIIKWITELLHVREILQVAQIAMILWPEFRNKVNEILGKVAEFSKQLGFGFDGLIHLIQATQGGIATLGGVLKKDRAWLELKLLDKSLDTITHISQHVECFSSDPGQALGEIFLTETIKNQADANNWWTGVSAWITETSEKAIVAIQNIKKVADNMQSLENSLPEFIRKHIPATITSTLSWTTKMVTSTVVPWLNNHEKVFREINNTLINQRDKASKLIDKLAHPGDVMLGLDLLSDDVKKDQLNKIDDVVSRKYNEDTDKYELNDKELINELDRTSALFDAGIAPLTFMSLEDNLPSVNPEIIKEPFETWFVGGYKSQY